MCHGQHIRASEQARLRAGGKHARRELLSRDGEGSLAIPRDIERASCGRASRNALLYLSDHAVLGSATAR